MSSCHRVGNKRRAALENESRGDALAMEGNQLLEQRPEIASMSLGTIMVIWRVYNRLHGDQIILVSEGNQVYERER